MWAIALLMLIFLVNLLGFAAVILRVNRIEQILNRMRGVEPPPAL